jgi:hypothetical protein
MPSKPRSYKKNDPATDADGESVPYFTKEQLIKMDINARLALSRELVRRKLASAAPAKKVQPPNNNKANGAASHHGLRRLSGQQLAQVLIIANSLAPRVREQFLRAADAEMASLVTVGDGSVSRCLRDVLLEHAFPRKVEL